MNPATLIDGYKFSHEKQYPAKTTRVYSNWTPRESRVPGVSRVMHFGLQFFLMRYLGEAWGEFFSTPESAVADAYAKRLLGYLGPNNVGTEHIRKLHAQQQMPLAFHAVPEGTSVPLRVPMLTIENTHDDFGWLTNYVETLFSSVLWMPCTSATTAAHMRSVLDQAAALTGTAPEFVDWQGHDFSFRGMPGPEAAAMSGAAHLIHFTGTDTLPALDLLERYYGIHGQLPDGYVLGGSVPATEHSVMCAGGELGELETFERLLSIYPSGIVSVVSDTWDFWRVLTEILPRLKARILARDGKLVIRPDSGDPADILCGDPKASPGSPASKGAVELLWEVFGGTTTSTGHRMLDSHIGLIYGDSITVDRAREITSRLAAKGFASGNVVFGVGSFTYQHVTRDTYGFAVKATWCQVDGEGRDLWKAPVTGNGVKNSAKGRLAVLRNADGELMVKNQATPEEEQRSLLGLVWRNGQFHRRQTIMDIREKARAERALWRQ